LDLMGVGVPEWHQGDCKPAPTRRKQVIHVGETETYSCCDQGTVRWHQRSTPRESAKRSRMGEANQE